MDLQIDARGTHRMKKKFQVLGFGFQVTGFRFQVSGYRFQELLVRKFHATIKKYRKKCFENKKKPYLCSRNMIKRKETEEMRDSKKFYFYYFYFAFRRE